MERWLNETDVEGPWHYVDSGVATCERARWTETFPGEVEFGCERVGNFKL